MASRMWSILDYMDDGSWVDALAETFHANQAIESLSVSTFSG